MNMNLAIEIEQSDDLPIAEVYNRLIQSVRKEYLSESQKYPWIIGFSGGKDSTLVTQAIIDALLSIAPSKRQRDIHIVSNDTLVESPLVIGHLNQVTNQISIAAKSLELPIKVIRTVPDSDKTFWVLLIGKGYPSPNMTMRWCTDRLKIEPTSRYIKEQVSVSGSAVVVLGVRKDESASRSRQIEKFKNNRNSNLTPHDRLSGAYIYRPIVDISLDQVWEILSLFNPPWGGNHSALIKLYRDSGGGECPVIISADDAPSCGTSNSRFGCWTCTVVEKDKSLRGFVDAGIIRYEPLIEFRDWLKSIRNDPHYRQVVRRNGKISFADDGRHIPGPFTIESRREIFQRLKEVENRFGAELISESEISQIKQIWTEELIQMRKVSDV